MSLPAKVDPSIVRRIAVDITDFELRPLAGDVEPSKAVCSVDLLVYANCSGFSTTGATGNRAGPNA